MPQQLQIPLDALRKYQPSVKVKPEGSLPGDIELERDQELPEVPSFEDPAAAASLLYQAPLPLRQTISPLRRQDPGVVPDERQFSSGVKVTNPPEPLADLPDSFLKNPVAPAAPSMAMPTQLRVPGLPKADDVSPLNDWRADAHWTTDTERADQHYKQTIANTPSALAGLKAASPYGGPLPAYHPQMRNQATVEALRAKLGIGQGGPDFSQADLESADRQVSAFPEMIEELKARSPLSVAQEGSRGRLAEVGATFKGQQQLQDTNNEQLQQLLSGGNVEPGMSISTHNGVNFRTAPPSQMLPAGEAGKAQAELQLLYKQLNAIPDDNSPAGRIGGLGDLMSGHSAAQRREQLRSRISQLESQLHIASGTGNATVQGATAPPSAQAPTAPAGFKYVPKPGGGWTAVPDPGR